MRRHLSTSIPIAPLSLTALLPMVPKATTSTLCESFYVKIWT
jgi:hypothetical protein